VIAALVLYNVFRNTVPANLWPVIFGLATLWPMLMFGMVLGTLMWTKGVRPSYALTPDGILHPRRDPPLLRWQWFDSFDTTDHGDGAPLLRLYQKARKSREITLPADSDLRERVIDTIAAHLPPRPSELNVKILPARGFFRRAFRRFAKF
jgi:hypothetical protein